MPTEIAWVIAVAMVMPMSTRQAEKRVENARAMSWLLSPSSATKMTPKATQNPSTRPSPRSRPG